MDDPVSASCDKIVGALGLVTHDIRRAAWGAITDAIQRERERCAKIVEEHLHCGDYFHEEGRCPQAIAKKILEG